MAFWQAYYHLVWATHERRPLIQPQIELRLYAYLVRKAAEQSVYVYAVNGVEDHVHMVVGMPPKCSGADLVKRLKGASSHDLNHHMALDYTFAWQRGYGFLTLGTLQLSKAIAYVEAQKEHHAHQTTNAWLERYAIVDEGPSDTGLVVDAMPTVVKESSDLYIPDDPLPF